MQIYAEPIVLACLGHSLVLDLYSLLYDLPDPVFQLVPLGSLLSILECVLPAVGRVAATRSQGDGSGRFGI